MYSQYSLQPPSHMPPHQPQVASSSNARYRSQSFSEPSSPVTSTRSSADTAGVGHPTYFVTGAHTGKTIRMELAEIQKADLGRKYAKVDRRPLDPPPVVLLKLYEVQTSPNGQEVEVEMTYDDTQLLGLLCTVELFPAAPSSETEPPSRGRNKSKSAPSTRTHFFSTSPSASPTEYGSPEFVQYHLQERYPSSPTARANSSHYVTPTYGATDIVHHINGFPITESSKQTGALVGATFVQPALIDYQGRKAIVFVFADLAVKVEGTFILRYRVFDIFGRQSNDELGVTAEAYGGVFRVYSTKEFPGLAASTELTKLLARWGVRLNIRETERRRRKRPASQDEPVSPSRNVSIFF